MSTELKAQGAGQTLEQTSLLEDLLSDAKVTKEQEGYEPYTDWRQKVAARMTPYMAPAFQG